MAQQPNQPNKRRQLRIEMPATLNSTYSNTVMISHTNHEFVFDFIHIIANVPRASIQERIVMTPTHAKMFLKALQENLSRYEDKHGEIPTPQRPESLADQLFRGVKPGDEDDGTDE